MDGWNYGTDLWPLNLINWHSTRCFLPAFHNWFCLHGLLGYEPYPRFDHIQDMMLTYTDTETGYFRKRIITRIFKSMLMHLLSQLISNWHQIPIYYLKKLTFLSFNIWYAFFVLISIKYWVSVFWKSSFCFYLYFTPFQETQLYFLVNYLLLSLFSILLISWKVSLKTRYVCVTSCVHQKECLLPSSPHQRSSHKIVRSCGVSLFFAVFINQWQWWLFFSFFFFAVAHK